MKKILKKIIIFAIPVLLVLYLSDYFISNGLRHSSYTVGEIEVWNDIYEGNIDVQCAICGSSRAWMHISPEIFEEETGNSAYNFGINGHSFKIQYLRYKEYLKYNPAPEIILYSLDEYTLQQGIGLGNKDQFLPFMLYNKDMLKATQTYRGFNTWDFIVPFIRYSGNTTAIEKGVKYHFNKPEERYRHRGYVGVDSEWNGDFEEVKRLIGGYRVIIDTPSVTMFENFIKECKKEKVRLIFVYTPEYIEGQEFVENRDSIMVMYRKWSEEYNIPYLDYSHDSLSYNKKYFYNAMHLNKKGSELFTERLGKELMRLNLID